VQQPEYGRCAQRRVVTRSAAACRWRWWCGGGAYGRALPRVRQQQERQECCHVVTGQRRRVGEGQAGCECKWEEGRRWGHVPPAGQLALQLYSALLLLAQLSAGLHACPPSQPLRGIRRAGAPAAAARRCRGVSAAPPCSHHGRSRPATAMPASALAQRSPRLRHAARPAAAACHNASPPRSPPAGRGPAAGSGSGR